MSGAPPTVDGVFSPLSFDGGPADRFAVELRLGETLTPASFISRFMAEQRADGQEGDAVRTERPPAFSFGWWHGLPWPATETRPVSTILARV